MFTVIRRLLALTWKYGKSAITRAVTGRTQIPYILDDVPDPVW